MSFRAGYINIIGRPNVGKSTLMNELVGEKLSIITSKAQTTRHRILGIVNGADFQIVFSDTPGIIKPHYEMQKSMMGFVRTAVEDADVLLVMVDVTEKGESTAEFIREQIKESEVKKIFILNKIDLINEASLRDKSTFWKEAFNTEELFTVSALNSDNVLPVFNKIIELLPEHPPYFPTDALTDKPERFFMSEIIREKIFLNYSQEVPYSVEVVVDAFKEEEDIIRISSVIYCNRKTQKPILIGKGGSMLKKVGTAARIDAEKFFGKKIYLEIFVKVKENWRENDIFLKRFGYK